MKKYTYLLMATGILLSASSCSKTYTCECDGGINAPEKMRQEIEGTKKKAKAKCADLPNFYEEGPTNCHLID